MHNPAAIQVAERRLGWRVYGTNQPATDLTLEQAVLAYRNEYLVERNFGRLKGRTLSLTPMYLADDKRATGLIRWLTVGLRILTLLEGVVRQRLSASRCATGWPVRRQSQTHHWQANRGKPAAGFQGHCAQFCDHR